MSNEPQTIDAEVQEAPAETEKVDYIEFVGTNPEHGTEFYGREGTHGVSKSQFKQFHDVVTPKDLVWKRGANGRFLVPVSDMSPEAAEILANDIMFKRVTL